MVLAGGERASTVRASKGQRREIKAAVGKKNLTREHDMFQNLIEKVRKNANYNLTFRDFGSSLVVRYFGASPNLDVICF